MEGRPANHLENVRISDSTFEIIDVAYFGENADRHGGDNEKSPHRRPYHHIVHCDRVVFDSVETTVV
jgi:hypothetical protein